MLVKEGPEDHRMRTAVWRYELIAPLVGRDLPLGARKQIIEELAGQAYEKHRRFVYVSARTIERYLALYRRGGLEMLQPKARKEQGALKAFPLETLEAAVELREAHPELSADTIIDTLKTNGAAGAERMRVSTLNRHFRRLAKGRMFLKRIPRKRYHLFEVDGAHDLWICDGWDGPMLLDSSCGKKRRLELLAILDSHTRFIVQAQFYFNENRPALEDVLLKGILKSGVPRFFYVDNAKIFSSRHLKRIAAELGFSVKHTLVKQPAGRGKLERWFRTVAEKFLPFLKSGIENGTVKTTGEANQLLCAWIEQRYHQRRHGTLKMSPARALALAEESGAWLSRTVDPGTVREAFLWRETRTVDALATVKIYGNRYEVDESLMRKSVELRYDPYDLTRVLVYCEGQCRGEARPYQMKNFHEKRVRERAEDRQQAMQAAMDKIVNEHAAAVQRKTGLSFADAQKEDESDA